MLTFSPVLINCLLLVVCNIVVLRDCLSAFCVHWQGELTSRISPLISVCRSLSARGGLLVLARDLLVQEHNGSEIISSLCGRAHLLEPAVQPKNGLISLSDIFPLLSELTEVLDWCAELLEVSKKLLEVKIIDDEEYEKNKTFIIQLGEPLLLDIGRKHGDTNDNKPPGTDEEEVSKMGCPSLGEHTKLEVVIEESYEFKNTVDKLIKKTNLALVVGSSSWREQFVNAVTVSAVCLISSVRLISASHLISDDDEEESGEERLPSCFDYIMHFLTVFWKVLFAFVPPTEYWNGWACFFVSISLIGVLTAVTGDLASHFGCTVGLKDSVTAVVFVALGTSVPDTFASKVAAIQDQYADASIGNVTGSNAVNVFLGIGVAWTIAAVYWKTKGKKFLVEPGSLAFTVTVFTIMAFVCVLVLMYRRRASMAGGELGGPRTAKLLTSLLFFSLWLIYILLASLEAYCHVPGF
ncbi:hypothetical protein DPEC_G00240440 [Dallia pectoralis]|uniref:Uncharacterized protein n=1 Tax=Dallia pectoralis TaxID=75939 RepID=A0ACC2FZS4_DALPE|nr:hypothetical protein DPEC_G00240440 [Dallia pectoralis]